METWDLRRNLTSFPLREAGYVVSAKYESGARPIGGAVIYLQASSPLGECHNNNTISASERIIPSSSEYYQGSRIEFALTDATFGL